jgi:hypothetical protein
METLLCTKTLLVCTLELSLRACYLRVNACSDTREEALELYEDMPWWCYLGLQGIRRGGADVAVERV